MVRPPPISTLFPYTTLFRSKHLNTVLSRQKYEALTDDLLERTVEPCRRALADAGRSEEHTSELQSQSNLVCRLLLEKKKRTPRPRPSQSRLRDRSGAPTVCSRSFASLSLFFSWYGHHRYLHSFPTRRSSDLSTSTPCFPGRSTRP